jgi:hypothetical protein
MATHYTNALPSATLPDLTTNGFRITETLDDLPIVTESLKAEPAVVARINLVEEDTIPQSMLIEYAKEAQTQIQNYHLDVFVSGLVIGVHLPQIGWMMLSYAATFPVLIAFQHPELFIQLYKKKPEYSVLLVSGLVACQAYALYCLRNLFV